MTIQEIMPDKKEPDKDLEDALGVLLRAYSTDHDVEDSMVFHLKKRIREIQKEDRERKH